jgi:hypothetical protein
MSEETGERANILAQKGEVSAKISENCRYIGFGLILVYYAARSNESKFSASLLYDHRETIFSVGLFGALTIFFDYLQYVCGYFSADDALKRTPAQYNDNSIWYHGRHVSFYAKQLAALLGAGLLVFMIASLGA